jgi:hypothetical protein
VMCDITPHATTDNPLTHSPDEDGWTTATSKRASPKPTQVPAATVTTLKRLTPNGRRTSTRIRASSHNAHKHDNG